MDYFNPFFTILQLLAALNFAQVSKGFRDEFARLIESWHRPAEKAQQILREATALSQSVSSLKMKVKDFFQAGNSDREINTLIQLFDTLLSGINSLKTPLKSKLDNKDSWGTTQNTPDSFKQLFMITGVCTTISMIFIAIAECHPCTSIIAYCYAVLAFVFIVVGGIGSLGYFGDNFDLHTFVKVVMLSSILFCLTYFTMFSTTIESLIPSCKIRLYNGLNAGCCLLVLLSALLSYILCAVKVFHETSINRKNIEKELSQFQKQLDVIKAQFKDNEEYVEKKIKLNSDIIEETSVQLPK